MDVRAPAEALAAPSPAQHEIADVEHVAVELVDGGVLGVLRVPLSMPLEAFRSIVAASVPTVPQPFAFCLPDGLEITRRQERTHTVGMYAPIVRVTPRAASSALIAQSHIGVTIMPPPPLSPIPAASAAAAAQLQPLQLRVHPMTTFAHIRDEACRIWGVDARDAALVDDTGALLPLATPCGALIAALAGTHRSHGSTAAQASTTIPAAPVPSGSVLRAFAADEAQSGMTLSLVSTRPAPRQFRDGPSTPLGLPSVALTNTWRGSPPTGSPHGLTRTDDVSMAKAAAAMSPGATAARLGLRRQPVPHAESKLTAASTGVQAEVSLLADVEVDLWLVFTHYCVVASPGLPLGVLSQRAALTLLRDCGLLLPASLNGSARRELAGPLELTGHSSDRHDSLRGRRRHRLDGSLASSSAATASFHPSPLATTLAHAFPFAKTATQRGVSAEDVTPFSVTPEEALLEFVAASASSAHGGLSSRGRKRGSVKDDRSSSGLSYRMFTRFLGRIATRSLLNPHSEAAAILTSSAAARPSRASGSEQSNETTFAASIPFATAAARFVTMARAETAGTGHREPPSSASLPSASMLSSGTRSKRRGLTITVSDLDDGNDEGGDHSSRARSGLRQSSLSMRATSPPASPLPPPPPPPLPPALPIRAGSSGSFDAAGSARHLDVSRMSGIPSLLPTPIAARSEVAFASTRDSRQTLPLGQLNRRVGRGSKASASSEVFGQPLHGLLPRSDEAASWMVVSSAAAAVAASTDRAFADMVTMFVLPRAARWDAERWRTLSERVWHPELAPLRAVVHSAVSLLSPQIGAALARPSTSGEGEGSILISAAEAWSLLRMLGLPQRFPALGRLRAMELFLQSALLDTSAHSESTAGQAEHSPPLSAPEMRLHIRSSWQLTGFICRCVLDCAQLEALTASDSDRLEAAVQMMATSLEARVAAASRTISAAFDRPVVAPSRARWAGDGSHSTDFLAGIRAAESRAGAAKSLSAATRLAHAAHSISAATHAKPEASDANFTALLQAVKSLHVGNEPQPGAMLTPAPAPLIVPTDETNTVSAEAGNLATHPHGSAASLLSLDRALSAELVSSASESAAESSPEHYDVGAMLARDRRSPIELSASKDSPSLNRTTKAVRFALEDVATRDQSSNASTSSSNTSDDGDDHDDDDDDDDDDDPKPGGAVIPSRKRPSQLDAPAELGHGRADGVDVARSSSPPRSVMRPRRGASGDEAGLGFGGSVGSPGSPSKSSAPPSTGGRPLSPLQEAPLPAASAPLTGRTADGPPRFLFEGSVFLKYGRFGKPHRKLVSLSEDGSLLRWRGQRLADMSLGITSSSIPVASFRAVVLGAQTRVFVRNTVSAEDANRCLSVVTSERTLDLQAPSMEVRDRWARGLAAIVPGGPTAPLMSLPGGNR